MDGKIKAEWQPLKKVVIHRPGIEMFFGLLDPTGSLYERPFSREGALKEHHVLETVLKNEFKIDVQRLTDVLIQAMDEKPIIRQRVIEMAKETMQWKGSDTGTEQSKQEFEDNIKHLDSSYFVNILLMNPTIELHAENQKMGKDWANLKLRNPLSNLYFMRDQQFVTDQGIVLTRMANPVRRGEPRLTRLVWEEVFGLPIIHEMTDPAMIEGGEFIPMGDFAMVGIGSRTNREAINQLLSIPMDYKEIAVVHQPMHPLVASEQPDPMINMHLDTYFNVAGKDVAVGSELLLKNAKVEIWKNEGSKYVKTKEEPTLEEYIRKKGFNLVSLTTLEQLSYASNFLCIEDKKILAIEVEQNVPSVLENLERKAVQNPKRYGKLAAQAKQDYENLKNEGQFFPHKKEMYQNGVESYPVVLKNLTGGYGGAHCMTCSLSRG
ncbi:MAG TPA: arginine deiminase family protein [Chlamydiales bacterium]|nr:arginine deiminase family protein [Chlamydiales bacterium]